MSFFLLCCCFKHSKPTCSSIDNSTNAKKEELQQHIIAASKQKINSTKNSEIISENNPYDLQQRHDDLLLEDNINHISDWLHEYQTSHHQIKHI